VLIKHGEKVELELDASIIVCFYSRAMASYSWFEAFSAPRCEAVTQALFTQIGIVREAWRDYLFVERVILDKFEL